MGDWLRGHGNVLLDAAVTGLPKGSVAVPLGLKLAHAVDDGVRAVLGL